MNPAPDSYFARLRARARGGIVVEGAACCLIAGAIYVFGSYLLDRTFRLEVGFRAALLLTMIAVLIRLLLVRVRRPLRVELNDDELALAVERQDPGLRQLLISGIQFDRRLARGQPRGDSRALMRSVVGELHDRLRQLPFARALDGSRVARFAAAALAAVAIVGGWAVLDPDEAGLWATRNLGLGVAPWPHDTHLRYLDLDPAVPCRVAEREDLTVRVAAEGVVPDRVTLHAAFASGEVVQLVMEQESAPGIAASFRANLEALLEPAEVKVTGGDGETETLVIELVPRPRISGLSAVVHFPEYLAREDAAIEDGTGDIAVPAGSRITLTATSSKPLREARVLFGDTVLDAAIGSDERSVRAEVTPEVDGALRLEVVDLDRLGPAEPPQLFVRVVPDHAPEVEFRTDGIGTLIVANALIPGRLELTDDHGLTAVSAAIRIRDATDGEEPADDGFTAVDVNGLGAFIPGTDSFAGPTMLDLAPFNPDRNELSESNGIRPGHLIGLRFTAADNHVPAQSANSDVIHLRVVTMEKLLDELLRRQIEQRDELERVRDQVAAASAELGEITAPGDGDDRAQRARARVLSLSRQQRALGDRCAGVAERYEQILLEFVHNRVYEPNKGAQLTEWISVPLRTLANEEFPASAARTAAFGETPSEDLRDQLVTTYDGTVAVIDAVLRHMADAKSLAAQIRKLEQVRKIVGRSIDAVEGLRGALGSELFGTTPPDPPDKNRNK